ncbi:hypothetical protein BKI52_24200 [marine bacterium AO1-C]|nr:hypothetical protein BKI52_24200 [marine bacterium AO1-C]
MTIKIPTPPLFSFQECLWFLDRNYDDCLHVVTPNSVLKAIELQGQMVLFEVKEEEDHLQIEVLKGHITDEYQLAHYYIKDWFDVDRDLRPFYDALSQDDDFAFMQTKYNGLRLMGIENLFETLGWTIIGQQINLKFAYTLKRSLVEHWGKKLTHQGQAYYIFPEPATIAALKVEDLRALKFTTRKAEYLIGVAQLFAQNQLSKSGLLALASEEKILAELLKIRGIGKWTAHYAMMKCLRTANNIPYGDTGLYTALNNLKNLGKRATIEEIDAVYASFEGWKSYLTIYLWRTLSDQK